MSRQVDITIEVGEFKSDFKKLMQGELPKATALAFRSIAGTARNDVRYRTRAAFDLRSNYILNGIKSLPESRTQVDSAALALRKYGDMEASVFVRASNNPKSNLDFLVDHEGGAVRTPHGTNQNIAIPARGTRRRSYRTSKGAVKARYTPKRLLAELSKKGANTKGHKIPQQTNDTENNYFIMERGSTTMIAKRDNLARKPLGFFYFLSSSTRIKPTWGFERTVRESVTDNYRRIVERYFTRMKM